MGKAMNWDVFISHASEDKDSFVTPLAKTLSRLGVKVWFDQFTLKLGDSLSRSIDEGLTKSKFGVVVISKAFMSKGWPEYELRGLTSREIGKEKVILPVWHGVNRDEVLNFSPSLADKFAVDTSRLNFQEIALQIVEIVRPDIYQNLLRLTIQKQIIEESEVRKVQIADIMMGPIRHKTLPATLLVRIKIIQRILWDVMPISLKLTINDFRRDAHPDKEVGVWEKITAAYLDTIRGKFLSIDQRKEILKIILVLSTGPLDKEDFAKLKYLSREEVKNLQETFQSVIPDISDPEVVGPIAVKDVKDNFKD